VRVRRVVEAALLANVVGVTALTIVEEVVMLNQPAPLRLAWNCCARFAAAVASVCWIPMRRR